MPEPTITPAPDTPAGVPPAGNKLVQALREYCVPKDSGGCIGSYAVAKYDQSCPGSNKCLCPAGSRWDAGDRRCQPCEFGTYSCATECSAPAFLDGVFVREGFAPVQCCRPGSVPAKVGSAAAGINCPAGSIKVKYQP